MRIQTGSRFTPVKLATKGGRRKVESKVDIALDRLNRGISMPSVLRVLQEIENMDDMVPADPRSDE